MKIISEITKRQYDSVEECLKAEEDYRQLIEKKEIEAKKLAETRKARAAEVEAALEEVKKAQDNYNKLLGAFLKDFKTYHYSGSTMRDFPSVFNVFDIFKILE